MIIKIKPADSRYERGTEGGQVTTHYKSLGFDIEKLGLGPGGAFRVKVSSAGFPWNFSYFKVTKDKEEFEIHMNLKVRGAHDQGIYCVDVAIVETGTVPNEKPPGAWECLENAEVVSFAEVKKLVVYPMLLAQFLGIVHEIKPVYLDKVAGASMISHFPPALTTIGTLSGNSSNIIAGFSTRGFRMQIVHSFDIQLARSSKSGASPFSSS